MIESPAFWFANDQEYRQSSDDADRAENDECVAPAVCGGNGCAESDTQRGPYWRSKVEDSERHASPTAGEVVRDDRIGWRHATSLTDADGHSRDYKLGKARGNAASHRRGTPNRASKREDAHTVGLVRYPADRNRNEAIEKRKIEAAD